MLKAVLIRQNRQHPLQPFVRELDYPPAALADEMFVVTLGNCRLVTLESLPKLVSPNHSAFHQKVQGPVDSSHPYPLPLPLQLATNALDGEVILGKKHDLGDEIPLAGERLMMFPKVAVEALEKSRSLSLIQSCH
jgi:hypothetical protein